MISSVGWDASASCAAIRAGLVRPQPLPGVSVLDAETQQLVPLVGHPIQGYTEGFALLARWARLTQGALDDLLRQRRIPGSEDALFWRRTRLVCIAPVLSAERFFEVRQVGSQGLTDAYTQLLQARLCKRIPVPPWRMLGLGHSGLAAALQEADRGITHAEVERYLLVAVDSYLDAYSLEWLAERRRLKTADRPVGLMPGEAGACLLVESPPSARRRGARIEAWIDSATVERGPESVFQEGASLGLALSRAVESGRPGGAAGKPFDGDVIIDLNGEVWRANAWGHARVRLSNALAARIRLVTFCSSLGEVGAASGAVGTCIATRAFARRYASGPSCLVVTSSEDGLAGCIHVRAEAGTP
jgi:3-oxoacyl-[acyl-carrier-protein] synthase-1